MHIMIHRWYCAGMINTRLALYTNGMRNCKASIVLAGKSGNAVKSSRRHVWRVF